jgi:hypothetical protein
MGNCSSQWLRSKLPPGAQPGLRLNAPCKSKEKIKALTEDMMCSVQINTKANNKTVLKSNLNLVRHLGFSGAFLNDGDSELIIW